MDRYEGQNAKIFSKVFDTLIDHAPKMLTRFDKDTSNLSRLYRTYSTIGAWMLPLFSVRCIELVSALHLHRQGLSDHCPVICSFGLRKTIDLDSQPISRDVLRSDSFVHFVERYYREAFPHDAPPPQQLVTVKTMIRAAARDAREAMHTLDFENSYDRPEVLYTFPVVCGPKMCLLLVRF